LMTATAYHSPMLYVMIVTDNAVALRNVLSVCQFPLNIVCREVKNDDGDANTYWLAWGHRKEIAKEVTRKLYSTVIYMEVSYAENYDRLQGPTITHSFRRALAAQDDTRVTWPTLVSWAIDTKFVSRYNYSRCFYRTEIDPTRGTMRLMDYKHGIDVRPAGLDVKLDFQNLDATLYSRTVEMLHGKACGVFPNGTRTPCHVHRYFVSTQFPFQVSNRL
jgi:hypothetical protein